MTTDMMLYVVGLALLDAISPTIIGVTLWLLVTMDKKIVSRISIYLGTIMLLYFLLGIVMMESMPGLMYLLEQLRQYKWLVRIVFGLGVLLFALSFLVPYEKKATIPKAKSYHMKAMIGLGLTTFMIEAGMALPYFILINLLTAENVPLYHWMPTIMLYNFTMILPAFVLLLIYRCGIKAIQPIFDNWQHKLNQHSHSVMAWLLCIIGVILIFYTIDSL